MRYAKPLDEELILEVGRRFSRVITIEDGVVRGGVGEAITALMAKNGLSPEVHHLGIDDRFVEQGTPAELYADCGYDLASLLNLL